MVLLNVLLTRLRGWRNGLPSRRRALMRPARLEPMEERLLLDCHLCDVTLANLRATNAYDYVAVASGRWADVIWDTDHDGVADAAGPLAANTQAKVLINPGATVTYDTSTASVGLIDVQG